MPTPKAGEYLPYFKRYIDLVSERSVLAALRNTQKELNTYLETLSENRGDYAYAEGKWTIRQVLQHLIDTERVFAHRALHIARGDANTLPSFEENEYADAAPAQHRSIASLRDELKALRKSTIFLFSSFDAAAAKRKGTVSGNLMSVLAIAHIIPGHTRHHLAVLLDRYK
jgi:uncharacterized damage-inducible protein DinB